MSDAQPANTINPRNGEEYLVESIANLRAGLERNAGVLDMQLKSVTHEESLVQPPYHGNCLNWILGHLNISRANLLKLAGLPAPWPDGAYARYKRDSDPIVAPEDSLPLERLRADFATTQELLLARLDEMTPDELAAPAAWGRGTTLEMLEFLAWHETYHVGQTEILRQVAGKNDKVI